MEYKNKSLWQDIKKNVDYPSLDKNIEVDVLIIGGGITGISCAYHLINSKMHVCLVEKNTIASGVTSRTTGKLTYLQENLASKINKYHGLEATKLYIDSQKKAIDLTQEICNKENIDCNLEQVRSYILPNGDAKKITKEYELLKKLNIAVKKSEDSSFFVEDTFVFHPIKYLYTLAKVCALNNIDIYENTKISSINKEDDYYTCYANNYKIKTILYIT